jgi:hypothetical protein
MEDDVYPLATDLESIRIRESSGSHSGLHLELEQSSELYFTALLYADLINTYLP